MTEEQTLGLILPPGPIGRWDDARVSNPCVLRAPDGGWLMWYYGRDAAFEPEIPLPTGRCGLARSANGVHWRRVPGPLASGAVLDPHPDRLRFDSAHLGCCDLSRRDGLYWMWYIGGDHARDRFGPHQVKGLRLRPGLAVSGDGLHWLRVEGPHRGALLDLGAPGEPDSAMVGWPRSVRLPDGRWRLYYHALDLERMCFVCCLAESDDGLIWRKRGEVLGPGEPGAFDERGIGSRHVLHHDGRWLMFYEGVGCDGHRSIGLAESDDGIGWTRRPGRESDGSVFAHAPAGSGRWDAFAVGTPCIVPMDDGGWRLYYVGANETAGGFADELGMVQQIGLALSDGPDYRRWGRYAG